MMAFNTTQQLDLCKVLIYCYRRRIGGDISPTKDNHTLVFRPAPRDRLGGPEAREAHGERSGRQSRRGSGLQFLKSGKHIMEMVEHPRRGDHLCQMMTVKGPLPVPCHADEA